MSCKRKIQLPNITVLQAGSAIGAVGTVVVPIDANGLRIHSIECEYRDTTANSVAMSNLFDDITLLINSTVNRLHNAAELEHLNVLNGTQYATQSIVIGANTVQFQKIFCAEPWRKDIVGTDQFALNVCAENGYNSFQLKYKLLAALPATASLTFWAWVEDVPANLRGVNQVIKKVYRNDIASAGVSQDVTTIDSKDAIQVIAIKNGTGGYINRVRLKQNKVVIMEDVNREANIAHLVNLNLNPANSTAASAFGYDIVLDADDPVNSALFAEGQGIWMQLGFSAAAAGGNRMLIERIGPPDGI